MKRLGIVDCALSRLEREVGPPYAFPEDIAKLGPGEVNRPLPWTELTDEQREFQATKMAIHAAMVDRMDREIGRVLAQLKAMGAFDNTLILFLSDNGASAEIMVRGDGHDPAGRTRARRRRFSASAPAGRALANTPFRRHKTWVHEGRHRHAAHRALAAGHRGARRTAPHSRPPHRHRADDARSRRRQTPETWDGKPVPPPPGKSLVPAFAKDGTVPHDYLWWLHEGNRALRVGDWKLVAAGKDARGNSTTSSTDRAESNDLAGAQPERVKEMAAIWTQHTEEFRALALKDATPEMKAKGAGKKKEGGRLAPADAIRASQTSSEAKTNAQRAPLQ